MTEKSQPWFLHVDLDAFFASVEQLDHPEYRGKPVIVGGLPSDRRSVVSTASYEARAFGVHSAMPVFKAYELCPNGIFVHGRMKRYSELSWQIMHIFSDFSPDIMQISIDEAFIDITGTEALFGPPELTARKIKERIKKETGLTVSVGLAPSKYLAKIASAMSKPDGFYFVKPGEEENFMLNLPLDKVWGIGNKTLESLHKSGIRTTRDVHEKSLDVLEFLFGKNTGMFLYKAVRGQEAETFSGKTKNHSISSETTFSYDIYDSYIAQTEILELAHHVMFRLLREGKFSKTAFLKIRYEDFSTVSIQKTMEKNIQTLDSFFDILKNLFNSKYENGRGIRLLGVGFDNITETEGPEQLELFEEFTRANEKKAKLEKAIVNLEQKHPEIKIHKARLLESINRQTKTILLIFAAFISGFLNCSKKLYAEDKEVDALGAGATLTDNLEQNDISEEPVSLFDWKINDTSNVEFLAQGYWKSLFTVPLTATFGYDLPFTTGTIVPVFKQEVDLSVSALLNKKWYLETEFADSFTKNTLAFGYKGTSYLNHARISNRKIVYPSTYSASVFGYDLKSGNNQSPGVMFHFEDFLDNKWESDLLVKYETGTEKSAVFYGNNKVTDSYIAAEDFLTAYQFALEKDALSNIKEIYLESSQGSYRDTEGRKYIKLSSSSYQIISSKNLLILSGLEVSDLSNPVILAVFQNSFSPAEYINSLGSWNDENSYFGKIQKFFQKQNPEIQIEKYCTSLSTKINGSQALILKNSARFSPFLCADTYDTGLSSECELSVISKSTETELSDYSAEYTDEALEQLSIDYSKEQHYYARILCSTNLKSSYLEPECRYPLGDKIPEIYLSSKTTGDTVLCVRNYTPVNQMTISTDAIADSVSVTINNQKDWNAVYNPQTGAVTLSRPVSFTDKIKITWLEESSSSTDGSFAAGTGFKYHFTPNLTGDFFISAKWPLSPQLQETENGEQHAGFTAFTTGIEYKNDSFLITDKTSFSVKNQNTTGKYIANNQTSENPQTYYLGITDAYKTKITPVLSSRISGTPVLLDSCRGQIDSYIGETDSSITGYKLPISWNFSDFLQNTLSWAACDINLNNGYLLSKASELELALKTTDFQTSEKALGYEVYLQLGIKAEDEFSGEDSDEILCFKLTGNEDSSVISKLNLSNQNWQTVRIKLSDYDRSKLTAYNDLRLIVVSKNKENACTSGTLYAGPYEIVVQNACLSCSDKLSVREAAYQRYTDDYASQIKWENSDSLITEDELYITSVSNFTPSDFTPYKTINLDFAYQYSSVQEYSGISDDFLTLILDTEAISPEENGKEAVKLILKSAVSQKLISTGLVWHTVKINPVNNQVFVDDVLIDSKDYELSINTKILPSRQKIRLNLQDQKHIYNSGSFYIDNLYYLDTSPTLNGENYFYTEYKKETKNTSTFLSVQSLQSGTISAEKEASKNLNSGSVSASANGSFSIYDLYFGGDISSVFSTDTSSNKNITHAGHEIKTTSPVFNSISASEKYDFLPASSTLSKTDSAAISIPFFPLKISGETSAKSTLYTQNQKNSADFSLELPFSFIRPVFKGGINLSQKETELSKNNKNLNVENYIYGWSDISKLEFSYGSSTAKIRKTGIYGSFGTVFTDFFNLSPELTYELSGNYKKSSDTTFTDKESINLKIPFSFQNFYLTLTAGKTAEGISDIFTGGNYFTDSGNLMDLQKSRWWFYTSIPFNDIFNHELRDQIKQSYGQAVSYNTVYSLMWKRNLSNSFYDFFIPSSLDFKFSRDIHASDTLSDILQLKTTITCSAVSIFGKKGYLPLFTFYESDEFISSLSFVLKMPYNSDFYFETSGYFQGLFYINESNSIKTGIDFSVTTNSIWNSKITVLWDRNSNISPVVAVVEYLFPKTSDAGFNTSRKDCINLSFSQTLTSFTQTYEYAHTTDINFLKNYTLETEILLSFSDTKNKVQNASVELSIGGKISF